MEKLVSTEWLAAHLGEPDLRVLECTVYLSRATGGRWNVRSGRADWEAGHIPTSGFADVPGQLCDTESPLSFMMPSPDRFAAGMASLGVGDGTRVVLYDRHSMSWATRLWWMLRAFGFDAAAVLDGGWHAWTAEGRRVSSDPRPAHPPAIFTSRIRPRLVAGMNDVRDALDDGTTCIVNALAPEQHQGLDDFYGRRGHIPGAINVPAQDLLDPVTNRYLRPEELARRFAAALESPVERVITYCGAGIAAASDAFVLTLLGHPNVAVYDGSLIEWAADPANPLVSDDG